MRLLGRHPNWTMLLGIVLTCFLVGIVLALESYGYTDSLLFAIAVSYVLMFAGFVLLPAWNIRKKGRSFFNLFWLALVPIGGAGWWIIMCLRAER